MKTLGLIGGISWESTTVYYRHLNELVRNRLGGHSSARILLWSFDFAPIAKLQANGDWDALTAMMIDAAKRLETAGADALLICANTMHKMAPQIEAAAAIPIIHVADVTARAVKAAGCKRPLLLGTRFTMEQSFIKDRLARHGVEAVMPDESGRALVHSIIYDELCVGIFKHDSKAAYLDLIEAERRKQDIDSVILGCTEIGMLLPASEVSIPAFDTTRLHAEAAIDFSLADNGVRA